jgi:SAM-dependent methyltransferase
MTESNPKAVSWDQRYSSDIYAYGKEANAFFSAQLEHMNPGFLLLPGEGEGRNAVYAAGLGWKVKAFDQSRVGQGKALTLASEFQVEISYSVSSLTDFHFSRDFYDLVGLFFFHADPESRRYLHQEVIQTLKPGGTLILEAFHKEQIRNNTGGPRSPEMLFDETTLAADFISLETQMLEKKKIILDEGPFHQGAAEIIRYIGIKSK